MSMSKITKAEMDAWNQAAIVWMEGLRQDIRNEVNTEESESDVASDVCFGRLAITVLAIAVAVTLLGIVLIKTGLLYGLGLALTIVSSLLAIGFSIWMTIKWISEITEEEESKEPVVVGEIK